MLADPSASSLKGCCGGACCSFVAWSMIPYVGSFIAVHMMVPPLRAKVAPVGAPEDSCLLVHCCALCALIQVQNELDIRAAAGQPPLQQGMPMVMAPGVVVVNPMAAPQ